MKAPGIFILAVTIMLSASGQSAYAMTGLPQVRLALYQQPDTDVVPALRNMAKRGDRSAMRLLADQLATSVDPKETLEAILWFERSFANGRGPLTALAAQAQIADRIPLFRPIIRQILNDALPWADPYLDPNNVQAMLDILLVYPELFSKDDWEHLLALHQQGCLEGCRHPVYTGRYLAFIGQPIAARNEYRKAMPNDARAVSLFQNSFGDEDDARHEAMLAYATEKLDQLTTHEPESLVSIATALSREIETYDEIVAAWLDAAVANGSLEARIAFIQMMMSLPELFFFSDAVSQIEVVAVTKPTDAQFLMAEAYLVKEWSSLNPAKAMDILQAQEANNPVRARLAIAELYTMGGLDEPDPQKALEIYRSLISENRNAVAYRHMASLFANTPALCSDPVMAWGYGQAALQLGQSGVHRLLSDLAEQTTLSQREEGHRIANRLISDLEARL